MILDSDGKPMTQTDHSVRVTEITRSFSYKHSIKDANGQKTYESADFFCAMRAHVTPEDDPEEIGRELNEMCMEQVRDDLRLFKDNQAAKRSPGIARSAA